jgi:hypothetical protein
VPDPDRRAYPPLTDPLTKALREHHFGK